MDCNWEELENLLPQWLCDIPEFLRYGRLLRELRLRVGFPPLLIHARGELCPSGRCITSGDLKDIINRASRYSAYAMPGVPHGYITAKGGHRIGLCGTPVLLQNGISSWKEIRSLCIRVARDVSGIGGGARSALNSGSLLILGPPGSGKTTLLRDLVRMISDERKEQIAVVDERGEIFPLEGGESQFPCGMRTDILSGCPKHTGIECLVRSMGPQWIAVDEITSMEDCQTMEQIGMCGVRFLATAHAVNCQDLLRRPVYRRLAETGLFRCAAILQYNQTYTVERLEL